VFGSQASSKWDEAKTYCQGGDLARCGEDAKSLGDDANTAATISTVGFVVGGAALVGGIVVFFTAPSDDEAPAEPAPTESALGVRFVPVSVDGATQFALIGRF
jgi:hypothetical protein